VASRTALSSIRSLTSIGSRRYETNDDSRTVFTLAMVTLGEGWHNNHKLPGRRGATDFTGGKSTFTYTSSSCSEACGIIWNSAKSRRALEEQCGAKGCPISASKRSRRRGQSRKVPLALPRLGYCLSSDLHRHLRGPTLSCDATP